MTPLWTFTAARLPRGQAVEGKPVLDALDEAKGNWASCVVDGKVDCSFDAANPLRLWACECALRALNRERKAGREPHAGSWTAIEVATRYANGLATKDELAAARDAAWNDARDAARDAWDAARDARDAAWAARDAWDAARDAERQWQADALLMRFDLCMEEICR